MDALATGLIAIFNGLLAALRTFASPVVLLAVVLAAACIWLAILETDELNRMGRKPSVGRH